MNYETASFLYALGMDRSAMYYSRKLLIHYKFISDYFTELKNISTIKKEVNSY